MGSTRRVDSSHLVKLGEDNYEVWKFQITSILEATEVWGVVCGTTPCPAAIDVAEVTAWMKEDRYAKSIIIPSLGQQQIGHVFKCTYSKEIWDKLAEANSDCSILNRNHTLKAFLNYRMKTGQSSISAYMELQNMARSLNELKPGAIDEATTITQIVSILPDKHYFAFKKAWDSVPEETQSMPMLLARLRKEDLELRQKEEQEEETTQAKSMAYAAFNNQQRRREYPTRERGYSERGEKETKHNPEQKKRIKCFNCGKMGSHRAKDCWAPKNENGNLKPRREGQFDHANPQQFKQNKPKAFMGFVAAQGSDHKWISDSGANQHICGQLQWFDDFVQFDNPLPVGMVNANRAEAIGKGTVRLQAFIANEWIECALHDVLYIPGGMNLFSEHRMTTKGYKIYRDDQVTRYSHANEDGPEAYKAEDGMWYLSFRVIHPQAMMSKAQLWHNRLSHINIQYIKNSVAKNAIEGIKPEDFKKVEFNCEECHLGKETKKPHPAVPKRETTPGQMVHIDIAGKMPVPSLGKAEYFLILKDDATGFRTVYFMKHKNEAAECIKEYVAFIECQTETQVKTLRSDNDTVFTCSELQTFLANKGIAHERSAPHTPQENGKAEREIRTIKDTSRSMMQTYNTPEFLWAEAVATTVYIHNRVLDKQCGDKTAFEHIFKRKPKLGSTFTFGCKAFAHIPDVKRRVWDPKAKSLIFVGYEGSTNLYRLYDPKTKSIIVSHDVTFDEKIDDKKVPVSINPMPSTQEENIIPETEKDTQPNTQDKETMPEVVKVTQPLTQPKTNSEKSPKGTMKVLIVTDEGEYEAEIPSDGKATIDLPRLRNRDTIKEPKRYGNVAQTEMEPFSFSEAIKSPKWTEAMCEEIESHKINGTWILMDRPPNTKLLESRWVYKIKRSIDGSIARWKARLVVKGFRQRHGIDYFETFSSVSRYESIRLLLAIAAAKGLQLIQIDIKTAFLYGELDETLFMTQPEGFVKDDKKVCKLIKSIYGLKQSPRCFFRKFSTVLKEIGMAQSQSDPCTFIGKINGCTVYIVIYVDDGLVISSNKEAMRILIKFIQQHFELTESSPTSFVGIEIEKDPQTDALQLRQTAYLRDVIEKFGMTDCKPASVPMQLNLNLAPGTEAHDGEFPYRELIGSLLFLARTTRPDISYAISKLSQFLSCYDETHWQAAKTVLRYLKGTPTLGLEYMAHSDCIIEGFTDSDYAGDRVDRKSTTGTAFFMDKSLISWTSQKQPLIAISSTEAEYIALAEGTKDAVWLRRFAEELGFIQENPTKINVDNTSTIKLAHNPESFRKSKHIDVRFHKTRELVENKEISVEYIPTTEQTADILTKPLQRQTHTKMKGLMNMTGSSMLALMMIFCISIPHISTVTVQNTAPVLWRKSKIPVTTGYQQVNLAVKLISPCDLLSNETVHSDLVDEAKRKCTEVYEHVFLNELEQMCPSSTWTSIIHRQKRFIPIIIGIIVLVNIAVVGLAVAGTTMGVKNSVKINEMGETLEFHEHRFDKIEERINLLTTQLGNLTMAFNSAMKQMESHQRDYDDLKAKSFSTSFTVSYIVSRLLAGQSIIKDASRVWKEEGRIHPPFLDFFNFTLPCGDECPLKYSRVKSCRLQEEKKTLYVEFTVSAINTSLVVLEADPFQLMLRKRNETCSVNYIGPKNTILSVKDKCIYSLNVQPPVSHELIFSPSRGCVKKAGITETKTSKHFALGSCQATYPHDETDYVQVKPTTSGYHIYCPESTLTIDNVIQLCPDGVFTLPSEADFMINEHEFFGSHADLTHQQVVDPIFTLKANLHLQPRFSWSSFIVPPVTEAPINHTDGSHYFEADAHKWSTGVCLFLILILIVVVIILAYCMKTKFNRRITVVAKPSSTDTENPDQTTTT
jgi:hypothetical protein